MPTQMFVFEDPGGSGYATEWVVVAETIEAAKQRLMGSLTEEEAQHERSYYGASLPSERALAVTGKPVGLVYEVPMYGYSS